MRKGKVSGAFLQAREFPGELYVAPYKEICEAIEDFIICLKRACNGLAECDWRDLDLIPIFAEAVGASEQIHPRPYLYFLFGENSADKGWQEILQQ